MPSIHVACLLIDGKHLYHCIDFWIKKLRRFYFGTLAEAIQQQKDIIISTFSICTVACSMLPTLLSACKIHASKKNNVLNLSSNLIEGTCILLTFYFYTSYFVDSREATVRKAWLFPGETPTLCTKTMFHLYSSLSYPDILFSNICI